MDIPVIIIMCVFYKVCMDIPVIMIMCMFYKVCMDIPVIMIMCMYGRPCNNDTVYVQLSAPMRIHIHNATCAYDSVVKVNDITQYYHAVRSSISG
jgi:hypothetical protein